MGNAWNNIKHPNHTSPVSVEIAVVKGLMLQWLPEKSAQTWDSEVTVCDGMLSTQALTVLCPINRLGMVCEFRVTDLADLLWELHQHLK